MNGRGGYPVDDRLQRVTAEIDKLLIQGDLTEPPPPVHVTVEQTGAFPRASYDEDSTVPNQRGRKHRAIKVGGVIGASLGACFWAGWEAWKLLSSLFH
jgi:hypothetical protein